ncbi:MAG: AtpZ/AtpI family protein [Acidimicrobiales bacterium]
MTEDDPDKCTTPLTSAARGPSKVPPDEQATPGLFALAGLGVSIALCVAGGVGLGIYLDGATHHSPLFTLLGLAFGVALAVAVAYAEIKRFL